MRQCNACHNQAERMRRSNCRSIREDRRLAQLIAELERQKSHRQIEILCSLACAEFGGLEGLSVAFVDYVRRAMDGRGATGLRCFQALVKLMQYTDEHRAKPEEMSDEDLGREVMVVIKNLIRQQPELALEAARPLGWTVTPA
jgi:hypothetical protein